MTISPTIVIKWNLYSLACRKLLNRFHELDDIPWKYRCLCLDKFNRCLNWAITDPDATNEVEVAQRFSYLLMEIARTERDAKVKEILEDISSGVIGMVSGWNYLQDLEQFREQGRQLAISFYEASPHHNCQQLEQITCELIPRYYTKSDNLSPMSFLREYLEDRFSPQKANVILVRFNESQDFHHYLSYPILFLHEYTAHAYTTDNTMSQDFYDGWMLVAVNEFLQERIGSFSIQGLHLAQINGLAPHILQLQQTHNDREESRPNINPENISLSLNLYKHFPEQFWGITHRLTAYRHKGDLDALPRKIIESLRIIFTQYKNGVSGKTDAASRIEVLINEIPLDP